MDVGQMALLIKQKLFNWTTDFIKLLPNLALAILVLLLFFFLSKFIRRLLRNALFRVSGKPTISNLFSNIIYLIILFIGFFIGLELLHLDKAVTTLLAGAGVIGLALGFAFQDLTANFISGIFIIFRKPFDAGHVVETNGFTGTVELIQLRSTIIRTTSGLQVNLPNKDIFQKSIINYTLSEQRRIELAFTIAASTDVNAMLDAVKNSIAGIPGIDDTQTKIYLTDFTGDKVKLEVWCWVKNTLPENFLAARHTIIQKIQAAVTQLTQKT